MGYEPRIVGWDIQDIQGQWVSRAMHHGPRGPPTIFESSRKHPIWCGGINFHPTQINK